MGVWDGARLRPLSTAFRLLEERFGMTDRTEERKKMRMWMISPALLCRKHLLGEHNELHMIAGSISRGKTLDGFVRNGLLEPTALLRRHEALALEMGARGYRHASPLQEYVEALSMYPEHIREAKVDMDISLADLHARCQDCAARAQSV